MNVVHTHADEIIVLDDGEIVECGKHNGLLKNNGVYTKLWKNQIINTNLVSESYVTS